MGRTARFCILCGQEIGHEPFCSNPECGRLPNFYRDAAWSGPLGTKVAPGDNGPRSASRPGPAGAKNPTTVSLGQEYPARRTMPLPSAPIAILSATASPHEQHPLFPGITEIGARPPAKVVIDRPEISSRHARIECNADPDGHGWTLTVVDDGSTNGTFVNDERVDRQTIGEEDRVRFANVEFEVRFISRDEPRVTVEL